jgi:hypothetical protein
VLAEKKVKDELRMRIEFISTKYSLMTHNYEDNAKCSYFLSCYLYLYNPLSFLSSFPVILYIISVDNS